MKDQLRTFLANVPTHQSTSTSILSRLYSLSSDQLCDSIVSRNILGYTGRVTAKPPREPVIYRLILPPPPPPPRRRLAKRVIAFLEQQQQFDSHQTTNPSQPQNDNAPISATYVAQQPPTTTRPTETQIPLPQAPQCLIATPAISA